MKKITISILLIIAILCTFFSATASAAEKYTNSTGTVKVKYNGSVTEFVAEDYSTFSNALRKGLEFANTVATDKNKATVSVTKGNYLLSNHLVIYSNTTLNATGSKFKADFCIMSSGSNVTSPKAYNGPENIKIIGGTWDMQGKADNVINNTGSGSSTFRFAHCQNIVFKNCTFKDNYKGHDLEIAGTNKVVIDNCKFINTSSVVKTKNITGSEAIQLDITTQRAMSGFPSYDGTPTKNVHIRNCVFKNEVRGIGAHHGTAGKPYSGIHIYNNTFTNTAGLGVYLINTNNAYIYDNTMTNVGSGVYVGSVVNTSCLVNTYGYSYTQLVNSVKKSKSYIFGNTISVRKNNNNMVTSFGVRAEGSHRKADDSVSKVKKGTYYVYGINVGINRKGQTKPNIISGNINMGVSLRYVNNAKVTGNKIDANASTKDLTYGIEARCSKTVKISSNTITNTTKKTVMGIMISDLDSNGIGTTSVTIENNKITTYYKTKNSSYQNYGIRCMNNANSIVVNKNVITTGNECFMATGYEDKNKTTRSYTITNNTMNKYNTNNHIVFRELKLSKKISGNYTSSKKACVISIA